MKNLSTKSPNRARKNNDRKKKKQTQTQSLFSARIELPRVTQDTFGSTKELNTPYWDENMSDCRTVMLEENSLIEYCWMTSKSRNIPEDLQIPVKTDIVTQNAVTQWNSSFEAKPHRVYCCWVLPFLSSAFLAACILSRIFTLFFLHLPNKCYQRVMLLFSLSCLKAVIVS